MFVEGEETEFTSSHVIIAGGFSYLCLYFHLVRKIFIFVFVFGGGYLLVSSGGTISSYLCLYFHLVRKIFIFIFLLAFAFASYSHSYLYLPVPLGVLKKSHREMFVPSLSKGKKCLSFFIVFHRIIRKG